MENYGSKRLVVNYKLLPAVLVLVLSTAPAGAAASLPSTFQKARIIPAKYSFAELQSAQATLDSNYSTLKAQGILLGEWGIDVAHNTAYAKVLLTDSRLTAAEAADATRSASGQSDLEFSILDKFPVSTSRTSDGTPHYGGAQISTTDGTLTYYCTSGFYWSAIALSGSGTGRFYISALGSLHVASYFTGSQAGVTGIRTSGAITGDYQVGSGNVTAVNISVTYSDVGQVDHLNAAQCLSNPGDSGGPVYVSAGSGEATAAGIISGRNGDTTCYYAPIYQIIAQYGGAPSG